MKAEQMWESYLTRTGGIQMYRTEPRYRLQYDHVRDVLVRLEVVLEDEGIDEEKRERILRGVLYGAPTVAEAEERLRAQEEAMRRVMEVGPWRTKRPS